MIAGITNDQKIIYMAFFDKVKSSVSETSQKVKDNLKNIKVEDITSNLNIYEKYFSESELLDKIKKFGKAMGGTVLYPVLLLYNLLKSGEIDLKDKAIIIGTLGYVILPLDFCPDTLPFGFMDDELALLAATKALAACIDEEIQQASKTQLHNLLGDFNEQSLDAINKILSSANEFINKKKL